MARRVERAEKLLQKGKTVEALQEYLQVLRDDPENDVIRQLAADLCLSLSRNQEAVALLGEVFERQVKASDATRASLTYKKLARYGTPTWEQKFQFGKLLEGTNKKLALGTYEAALEDLATLNKKQESLQVLDRIVTLDPSLANFLRLAEVSSETGHGKASAVAFQRVAQLTAAEGGDPAQWYERAYQEHSSDAEISLAYGKSLLAQGQVGAAIFILEPQVNAENATLELRDTYSQVLMAAGRYAEAEPLVWQLFEQNPTRMDQVISVIGQLLDSEQEAAAVALARKLEQFQRRRGERRQFLTIMQDITAAHRASAEMLEFLSELYNASNRENDYCQTLLKLFDLYCSTADFAKAAECLDRAAEVDPYEPGHSKRLAMLDGKIDSNRFKVIASRFSSVAKPADDSHDAEEPTLGASTLQDLMLQAEILVQYGMRNKAVERLQRIQELFPREEERNEDLQRLYLAAGVTPRYAGPAPLPPEAAAFPPSAGAPGAPEASSSHAQGVADVRSFTRVAEITRKLYNQSTATAVLTTAVNEIGRHWELARCVAAMRKPGLPPTAVQQSCADGLKPASSSVLAEVICCLYDATVGHEPITIHDAQTAAELQPVRKAIAELGAMSVLAIPLKDGEEAVGLLLLMHNKHSQWQPNDVVVLRTLGEQMVTALNNAGLRRLVKNLSVTDEKSGLLKRASYIDLLLAESKRALQNASPLSLLLLQFGKSTAMVKEHGDAAVETAMEKIGKLAAGNIRSNDLAFRYDTTTIAIILGDTAEKEGMMAVEKLRKLIAEVRLPAKDAGEKGQPLPFSGGLAEAVVRENYDPVDIVTEVINRAEHALTMALTQGPGKVAALGAALAAGAVA
jgi:tetratricopeptide (TPR) repeat protein/GGDEF domain-containing protein